MVDAFEVTDFDLQHRGGAMLTLAGEVAGEGRHTYRSTNRAEYGHIKLLLSPFRGDYHYRFEWHVHGSLPPFTRAAVLAGVKSALQEELRGGCRVSGVKIVVVDGSYHETDSSPRAFELAAQSAVRDAVSRARLVKE